MVSVTISGGDPAGVETSTVPDHGPYPSSRRWLSSMISSGIAYVSGHAGHEALEQDVFRHVHLENHVLKPRFEDGARANSSSGLRFDLAGEAAMLETSASMRESGYSAKTLIRRADSRVLLIAMRAGARIQEHRTSHSIMVQTLSGHVRLNTPSDTADLPANTMLFLEASVPHDVVAHEDSSILVTIDWDEPR